MKIRRICLYLYLVYKPANTCLILLANPNDYKYVNKSHHLQINKFYLMTPRLYGMDSSPKLRLI